MGEVQASRRGRRRFGALAVVAVAIAGALLLTAGGPGGSRPPGSVGKPAPPRSPVTAVGEGLAVTPGQWAMVAGQSVRMEAYLVPASNGCLPIDAILTWQIEGGDLLGYLNTTRGSFGTFIAFSYAIGPAVVTVTANGLEYCGGVYRLFNVSVDVVVRIFQPLEVGDLVPTTDPVTPGSPETLTSAIGRGLPPYAVTVYFGDGGSESFEADAAGPIEVRHIYAAGVYYPAVAVADVLGESVNASDERAVVVSLSCSVAVVTSGTHVDVGVPIELNASVDRPYGPYQVTWQDSEGHHGSGGTWWLNLTSPGVDEVGVTVLDSIGDVANASLQLLAAPLFNLSLAFGNGRVDLGEPFPLNLSFRGGTAPYAFSVTPLPAGAGFSEQGVTLSSVSGAIFPTVPGALWVEVSASDALGAHRALTAAAGTVSRLPYLAVNLTSALPELGHPFGVIAEVDGGAPPFLWQVSATNVPLHATAPNGTLPGPGLFSWSALFGQAGPVRFLVSVRDATGASAEWNATAVVLSALSVHLRAPTSAVPVGGSLTLTASVSGGSAPYNVSFVLSDGEANSRNLSEGGAAILSVHPASTGLLSAVVTVVDSAGYSAMGEENLSILPASNLTTGPGNRSAPPPPAGGDLVGGFAEGLGATLGVALLGGVGWFLWRRRRGRPALPGRESRPNAVTAVRRLIRENEGIDRDSLILLAEEEGVGPASVEGALHRWESLGRLRVESADDGNELYSWTERGTAPEPGEPRSEAAGGKAP